MWGHIFPRINEVQVLFNEVFSVSSPVCPSLSNVLHKLDDSRHYSKREVYSTVSKLTTAIF
jgi:hypothetical protein